MKRTLFMLFMMIMPQLFGEIKPMFRIAQFQRRIAESK